MSLSRRVNNIKSKVSTRLALKKIINYPVSATVEVTNKCNLRCPVCDQQQVSSRNYGLMTFDNFKKIIDEIGPYLLDLGFSDTGETFINRDSHKMISYTRNNYPHIYTYMDTNGHYINPEQVCNCGINKISFSIDGLDQDTYSQYRIQGRLEKVIDNLKKIKSYREKNGKNETIIELKFIVMKHNQHQLPYLEEFSKELGVDEVRIEKFTSRGFKLRKYSQEESINLAKKYISTIPKFAKYDIEKSLETGLIHSFEVQKPTACQVPFTFTEILYNGDVRPCVVDFDSEHCFGNIFEAGSFWKVWTSKKAEEFRRNHSDKTFRDKYECCKSCMITNYYDSEESKPLLKAEKN